MGKLNHRDFLLFLLLESAALLLSVGAGFARALGSHMELARIIAVSPSLVVFIAVDLAVALPVIALTVAQLTQVARNVTTNELANAHRYSYLRSRDGGFTNPFDRGWKRNLRAFFFAAAESRDRDVEYDWTAPAGGLDSELQAFLSGAAMTGSTRTMVQME